ncbi:PREDICTED: uncharacterized protein LOC101812448 [Ficedula albicollis]|uniref:uncharacterized protein LOC101812448 n=1 Tax=Ficedula albicollis TaxID=59894 RepID=UPI00035961FF|nr:PREDICTED: uncharacterized protein LOC101812448 [Ficedula albicollis]
MVPAAPTAHSGHKVATSAHKTILSRWSEAAQFGNRSRNGAGGISCPLRDLQQPNWSGGGFCSQAGRQKCQRNAGVQGSDVPFFVFIMLNAKSLISSWPKSPKNFFLAFNFQLAEPLKPPSSAPEAVLSSHPPCRGASEMDGTNHPGKTPAAFPGSGCKSGAWISNPAATNGLFRWQIAPWGATIWGAEGWNWEAADQFPHLAKVNALQTALSAAGKENSALPVRGEPQECVRGKRGKFGMREAHGFAGKTWGLFLWDLTKRSGTGISKKEAVSSSGSGSSHTCHLLPNPNIMDSIPKFLVSHKGPSQFGHSYSPQ